MNKLYESIEGRNIIKEIANKDIEPFHKNCITGDDDHLYKRLKASIKKATSIDIIVAFLMESGVRLLEKDLREALERNIPIRILTGNYLNITQPSALYLLKEILGDKVDLRFYKDKSRSFHPKAYIFEYEDEGDIFVGSSNISKSALTYGIEWNYRISKLNNENDFEYYKDTFENLFFNNSIIIDEEELKKYSKQWMRPKLYEEIEKDEEPKEDKVISYPSPKGAQIEALYELNKTRDEGLDKALIVAATGVGKTYLAAFDSREFNRVLFVAHRAEILNQAERSFKNVRPNAKTGFFMNSLRDKDVDILFATVQTLGKKDYLTEEYFPQDYFDYIIIDEFHHAAAGNYQNIIEYFNPKFLLGLTATPDRLDNKDVYALCDYNLAYEVGLKTAINKGWLVPFRYYGIYDKSINYENIEFKNGKYNEKELEEALSINKRAELIVNNYKKYKTSRALGFCTSKKHAKFMADYFNSQGIKACAVYSGEEEGNTDREEAISKLTKGEIKIIFSVDMFNEGLDIPSIDMVMFLRPTESPTVFLQQLGRGLRKYGDKKFLNVLDFIGNYKKANLVPFFLTGDSTHIKERNDRSYIPSEEDYPEDCLVDFQWQLIDIFKKMDEANKKIQDLIIEDYYRVKGIVGKIPSRLEIFTYMDDSIYENMKKKSKENIFNNYLRFLDKLNELTEEERALLNTKAEDFINMLETTNMSKTYKLPVFLAFYNNGNLKMKIHNYDIYRRFKEFYTKRSNAIDLARHKTTNDYKNWGEKEYVKLAKDNPIKFLLKSTSEFFYKEGKNFCLNSEFERFINNEAFLKHLKDAVEFREREFYRRRLGER